VGDSNALRSGPALALSTVSCLERIAVEEYPQAIRYHYHVSRRVGARRERHEKSR